MKKLLIMPVALLMVLGLVAAEPSDPRVKVVHLSPDAPDVDVWVDGMPGFIGLGYMDASPWAKLTTPRSESETLDVQVVEAGTMSPYILDTEIEFDDRFDYTVIAHDYVASIDFEVLRERRYLISTGWAKVRFFHAVPDAPAVDVRIAGVSGDLFDSVSFSNQNADGYKTVPAGTYDLEVYVANTDTKVLDIPGVELESKSAYTAYARGTLAADAYDFGALLVKDLGPGLGPMRSPKATYRLNK